MRKCKGEEREKQAEKILKEIVVKTYKIWWKVLICRSKQLNYHQVGLTQVSVLKSNFWKTKRKLWTNKREREQEYVNCLICQVAQQILKCKGKTKAKTNTKPAFLLNKNYISSKIITEKVKAK
jgi:hypothetical protein